MKIISHFIVLLFFAKASYGSDFYTGAVVEYDPEEICSDIETARELMLCNIDVYEVFVTNAAKNDVDIIVFPEYGITGVDLSEEEDRERAKEFMVEGVVGINYCGNEENTDEILKEIGCIAKRHKMYIVVNMGEMVECNGNCEHEDGLNFYNTNFVFDRSGSLIAKYWKQNLFMEPVMDVPKEHRFTYFETDFGVTFGTFICFDALWGESVELLRLYPNITDIVYPTAWVDEMPFMIAPVEQNGWAVSNNVNFLASGYHDPKWASLGSGIYSPSGPLNYTYDENSGSLMVFAKIPKIKKDNPKENRIGKNTHLFHKREERTLNQMTSQTRNLVFYEDLSRYSFSSVDKNIDAANTLCHTEEFCCHFEYKVTENNPDVSYLLLSYAGERSLVGGQSIDVEVCGLVLCHDDVCGVEFEEVEITETFEYFNVMGNFSTNAMILPSVLKWSAKLPDWNNIQMDSENVEIHNKVELTIEETELLSAALYARLVDFEE